MKAKDILLGLFALALVGALAYVWLSPEGLKRAPDIALRTIDGNEINLSELRGRPVLVTFWATSCPGCVKEIPHLIELHQEFGPRGLQLVAVAMSYDPPDHVLAMRDARQIPYPIALDIKGEAARAFGDVRLTPTSFLIAPDGRIVRQKIGEMEMADVRAQIRAMLGA
ncbi:MAG: TlpA family protein disulfide reductase [Gammaproteobacteria bacterium]|jgi:peroxiredoxin|nr:TlpA family protein disulfide reductase [Gammaproteobacteria bacterium]